MKKQLFFITLMLSGVALSAQVEEVGAMLSLGKQAAFVIDHPGADEKMVSNIWEDAIKQYGKIKKNKKAGEWACNQCVVPLVSTRPMDIYYKIDEGKDISTSYTFFDDGEKFIDSDNDPKSAKIITDILQTMAYDVEREVINNELKNEEDRLKDYVKDLSKLEKKNEDLHNDIEDYKEKIRKAEKEIEKNFEEQADKKMEIEKQGRIVQKVTDKLNNVGRQSF
jgi:hypothetical protein